MGVLRSVPGILGGVREWTPAQLFLPGDTGIFINPSDGATAFQDTGGATPSGSGNPLGLIRDLSGSGNHLTSANKPTRNTDGTRWWIERASSGNVMSVAGSASGGLFKFLHDGTGCEVIAAAKFGTTSHPDVFMPLLGNNGASSSKTGMAIWADDRTSQSRTATLATLISKTSTVQNQVTANNTAPCNTDLVVNSYYSTSRQLNTQIQRQLHLSTANALTPGTGSSTHDLTIFGEGASTAGANMRIYGLFIINRVLTLAERTRVVAWMEQKAGIAAQLYSVNATAKVPIVGASPFNGYPGIARLNTGSQLQLVAAYRTSANEINTDGVLNYKITEDGGATWGSAATLYNPGAGLDARGVSLLLLQNGTILANFAVANTSVYNTWNSYVMIGTVSGATISWGAPILINGGAGATNYISYGQGVQLSDGTIVLPMQFALTGKSYSSAGVIKSLNAAGTAWSDRIAITPAADANSDAYNETGLVVFGDDSLAAYIRHDAGATKGYARAQSADIDNWTGLADVISIASLWGQPTPVNRETAVWLMARNASAQSTYWQTSDAEGTTFGAGTVYANNNMHQAAILLPNGQIGAAIGQGSGVAVALNYQQFA